MKTKEQIIRNVQEYSKMDASIYGDLLSLIGRNWKEAQEAQQQQRSKENLRALSEMLNNLWYTHIYRKTKPRLWDNMECCTIMDALEAVMPTAAGSSNADRDLLSHFAKSCRALGWKPEDDFILKTRGKGDFFKLLYKNFK